MNIRARCPKRIAVPSLWVHLEIHSEQTASQAIQKLGTYDHMISGCQAVQGK